MKIHLKDLQGSQLNNECLLLMMKFIRELKVDKGVRLSMQDKDILMQISNYANESDSPELKSIYADLKAELKTVVADSIK